MTEAGRDRIIAVGGAHIDRRGRVDARFVPGASNPGRMREEVGGGALNAARMAAALGASVSLISVRGGDAAGEAVGAAVRQAGILDLSAVFLDRATPSYTAILDSGGDVVAALADMELYDIAFRRQMRRSRLREAVAAADAVLCDANLPAAALETLCAAAGEKPVFAIAISPAKAVRLAGVLGSLSALFMNAREAAALAGGAEAGPLRNIAALQALGLKRGFITRGAGAALAFEGDAVLELAPPAVDAIPDVTGAGDAFAAGAMMALLAGRPTGEALRQGVAAAALKLRDASAAPSISRAALDKTLRALPTPTKPQAESCE
jgi:sugar/nucleoside kinase (ribokinase family)